MAQSKPTKPGNVMITRVGHTHGTKFGVNPNLQEQGKSEPTPVTFGKGA